MTQRELGTVKWFNIEKGYGFICRDTGGDIFVHFSQILADAYRPLLTGERVEFLPGPGRGGPQAVEVRILESTPAS
jgi:CspA family cold shock protein